MVTERRENVISLLNFIKDTSKKKCGARSPAIICKRASSSKNIQKLDLPGADNINIDIADDKGTVTGKNISQELREKILVAIGNIACISGVEDKNHFCRRGQYCLITRHREC